MKTRKEYLAICQTCQKSTFSKQKGIICSLTGDHAAYETEDCPDYHAEEKAVKRIEAAERRAQEEKEDRKGIFSKNLGIPAGVLLIVAAIAWILVGVILMDRIFFYPLILLVAGIIAIINGVKQKKATRMALESDVLDEDMI